MKKVVLLVVLALLILGGSLFAQKNTHREFKESDFYYVNVSVEKIYTHRLGFVVVYRKGPHQITRTFIPHEWFSSIGGKAELIGLGTGTEWPSMTVYYENGEFSHVRLRARRHRGHESWGYVPLNADIDEYFSDVEEIKLEF